jgi:DNA gyrase subunit A
MGTKDEDAVTNLFVTSTHNPVLFFSTAGKVYRMKVWRLPRRRPDRQGHADGQPASRSPRRNHLDRAPFARGRGRMGRLHIMFATAHGTVRRNSMDAFTNVPTAGKIAMQLRGPAMAKVMARSRRPDRPADGRRIADRGGRCPAGHAQRKGDPLKSTDVREFQSRTSTGSAGSACWRTTK